MRPARHIGRVKKKKIERKKKEKHAHASNKVDAHTHIDKTLQRKPWMFRRNERALADTHGRGFGTQTRRDGQGQRRV